jgi:hypothetical protein
MAEKSTKKALQGRLMLRMPSAALHVESKMSLLAHKAWLYLIYHAYPNLQKQDTFEIHAKTLAEGIGHNRKDLRDLISAVQAIKRTNATFNYFNKGEEYIGEAWLIADWQLSKQARVFEYGFAPRIRRLLLDPEMYTWISLIVTQEFTGKYALPLYCALLDYYKLGSYSVKIDEIRGFLCISDTEYQKTYEFKRWVLDRAVDEINKVSELEVTYEPQKKGVKVTGYKFHIKMKPGFSKIISEIEKMAAESVKSEEDLYTFEPISEDLIIFLTEHGINLTSDSIRLKLRDIVDEWGYEKAERYLLHVSKLILKDHKQGKVKAVPGAFIGSVQQGTFAQNFLNHEELQEKKHQQLERRIAEGLQQELERTYKGSLQKQFSTYLKTNFEELKPTMEEILKQEHATWRILTSGSNTISPDTIIRPSALALLGRHKAALQYAEDEQTYEKWLEYFQDTPDGKLKIAELRSKLATQ